MSRISRREALRWAGAGALAAVPAAAHVGAAEATGLERTYSGTDFSGWSTVVGDGLYEAPGEPMVALSDIATHHYGTYTQLQANVARRRIMAHNITFRRINDDEALRFIHTFEFSFRLPYLPSTANTELNAQTLEGGQFVWDGSATRLDYGIGFQWSLNPWDRFGELRCWTDIGGGLWQAVGELTPDTAWHRLRMVVDYPRQTTALVIDQAHFPCRFTGTPKTNWGREIAAGAQIEIVSLYPGPTGPGALHKADFREWVWSWELGGACRVFMPLTRGA